MKTFCVPLVHKGLSNYVVEAETVEAAEALARTRFLDGDNGTMLGNEWEEVERVGAIEEVPVAASSS